MPVKSIIWNTLGHSVELTTADQWRWPSLGTRDAHITDTTGGIRYAWNAAASMESLQESLVGLLNMGRVPAKVVMRPDDFAMFAKYAESMTQLARIGPSDLKFDEPKMASCAVSNVRYASEDGPGIATLTPKRPDHSVAWLDEDLLCADAD